jgi:CHAT domain-containing protein
MPTTPGGYGSLNTTDEVAAIKKHSQGLAAVSHLIRPTKSEVIKALRSCALAHFACHGSVNSVEPAKSSLMLGRETEENLTVDETIEIVMRTGPRIAYLSACSTAEIKAHSLINEAIHIASAFQLAGFQHVIGALWRVDDSTAVAIAGKFYELLFQQEKMTDGAVSYALHNAVLHYRGTHSSSAEVLKWASFIHLGCLVWNP